MSLRIVYLKWWSANCCCFVSWAVHFLLVLSIWKWERYENCEELGNFIVRTAPIFARSKHRNPRTSLRNTFPFELRTFRMQMSPSAENWIVRVTSFVSRVNGMSHSCTQSLHVNAGFREVGSSPVFGCPSPKFEPRNRMFCFRSFSESLRENIGMVAWIWQRPLPYVHFFFFQIIIHRYF
jgi:hypothetical protein